MTHVKNLVNYLRVDDRKGSYGRFLKSTDGAKFYARQRVPRRAMKQAQLEIPESKKILNRDFLKRK